jgi:glycosyltransferase involved in cell wall biosynthesis
MAGISHETASRNAPCHCGSGRRYKECHGALGAGADQNAELGNTMRRALACHQAGQHREALRLYARALEIDPANVDATHMTGVVHYQLGEYDRAIGWIERAIALRPDLPALRSNLLMAGFAERERSRNIEYRHWIERFDNPPAAAISQWRSDAARQVEPTIISIAMPTYNSPDRWLRACLDSVLAQTWPHWELCIADDASTLATTRSTLDEYAKRDSRIRVEYRAENGGIAAASNAALGLVTGKFVALIDHDDEIAPWALQLVAEAIARNPDAVLLYSDEDKIDEQGRRYQPYFKPEWDPVLLVAQNYISHLSVYRAEALRSLGGFRLGFDGAQDWDLVLRVSETTDAKHIIHVPHVLYHWRAIEGSTARAMRSKAYADAAQHRAVASHVARTGARATIIRSVNGAFLQTDPILTEGLPKVCLFIWQSGERESDDRTARWRELACTAGHDAVFVRTGGAAPAIGGIDASPPAIDRRAAAEVNAAVARADAEVVILVDEGLVAMAADWLELLVRHASQATAGAVGALLYDADRRTVHAGYVLDPTMVATSPYVGYPRDWLKAGVRGGVVQSLSAVGLGCMAVRKRLWVEVGGLDTRMLIAKYRDVDFCLRLADNGYRNRWHPGAELAYAKALRSEQHGLTASEEEAADRSVMQRRWGSRLASDRAYNPNLAAAPRLFELNEFADLSRDFLPLSLNAHDPVVTD